MSNVQSGWCSSVAERVLGKDEVMGSTPITSSTVCPVRVRGSGSAVLAAAEGVLRGIARDI